MLQLPAAATAALGAVPFANGQWTALAAAASFAAVCWATARVWRASCRSAQLSRRAAKRRSTAKSRMAAAAEAAAASLPPPEQQRAIRALSATALLAAFADGLSPVAVMATYIHAATQVHAAFNCCTEDNFAEAMEAAAESERRWKAGGARRLEGLPLSVKDSIGQRGMDGSCGMAVKVLQPWAEDGAHVAMLREAGAIPFVRTNVPQGLLLPETANFVYGVTLNPFNTERSPGGSSGGEAALVAAGGSVLGIGSDIGGSVRIPAAFTGLFSFKPTPQRFSRKGMVTPRRHASSGQEHILTTAGPVGTSVEDLLLVLETWCGANSSMWQRDVTVARMPWAPSAVTQAGRLTIGFYTNDSWFTPAPSCERATMEAVAALQAAGHTVVPFTVPNMRELVLLTMSILSADGAAGFRDALEGEAPYPYYRRVMQGAQLPNALRGVVAAVLRGAGQRRASELVTWLGAKSTAQLWALVQRRDLLQRQVFDAWQSAGLDAVICPATAVPAFRHGASGDISVSSSYTFVWNLLHCPAGIVPATTVRTSEEVHPLPHAERDTMGRTAQAQSRGAAGLPVGVQVVGLPFADEGVARVMMQLQQHLPPRPVPASVIAMRQ